MESKAIETAVQETKERCSKNGILRFSLIAIMIVFITCTACGKKQEQQSEEEDAVTVEIPASPTEEVVADPESVETSEPEVIEEPELEGIEAVVAYAKELDNSENYVAYWDLTANQATILENGQQFSPKVGDYIIIGGSTIKGYHTMPNLECDIDNTERNHFIIPITEEFANSDHLGLGFWDNDENYTDYEFALAGKDNGESTPTRYSEFLETTDRTDACIVVTDKEYILKDIILEDGDSYTLAEDEWLNLYLPKKATSISTTTENAKIDDYGSGYISIYVYPGTNTKVPISIEYTDGTTEELTIYITR